MSEADSDPETEPGQSLKSETEGYGQQLHFMGEIFIILNFCHARRARPMAKVAIKFTANAVSLCPCSGSSFLMVSPLQTLCFGSKFTPKSSTSVGKSRSRSHWQDVPGNKPSSQRA